MAITAATIATALIISGSAAHPVTPETPVPTWLQGEFQGSGTTSQNVLYPRSFVPGLQGNMPLGQSVPIGVRNTITLENEIPGPKTIMGTSQGALVADRVMEENFKAGVPKDQVSFVVIADPERGNGILTHFRGVPIPGMNYTPKKRKDTPYDVTVVTKEYEGLSDFPNNPRSPGFGLAVINAMMGAQMYHSNSVYSDLSKVPSKNIHTTVNSLGGKTTTYLVPTKTLPILAPLAKVPHPPLNGILKPLIDSAYQRGDSPAKVVKPAVKPPKHAKKGKK